MNSTLLCLAIFALSMLTVVWLLRPKPSKANDAHSTLDLTAEEPTTTGTRRKSTSGANRMLGAQPNISSPPTANRTPSAPIAVQRSSARWLPAGEAITIAGHTIPGGLLYVGAGLAGVASYRDVEPSLIDPKLPARLGPSSRSGEGMGYWPSYSSISPEHRAGYLAWLASGRSDPDAYVGYVFLFFYGLERRLLAPDSEADEAARAHVVAEVVRLQGIYGQNGSFAGYSSRFLAVCRLKAGGSDSVLAPTLFGWEIPPDVLLRLGRHASSKVPVPAELAFTWACNLPNSPRRTPATRCTPEFRELFEIRYARAHGAGVVLKNQGPRLRIDYQPASPSFGGTLEFAVQDVRDVSKANAHIGDALGALASACVDELDPYSRWLGRNASGEASMLTGVALMPKDLLQRHGSPALADLRQWLSIYLPDDGTVVTGASELLARWKPEDIRKVGKADAAALLSFLEKLGVGLEPDVRFGGPTPDPQGQIVLFRLASESAAATAEYAGLTTLLRFAAAVAGADGIADAEAQFLMNHVGNALGLTKPERRRLTAHVAWLLSDPPNPASLKKAASALTPTQRADVGRFLVSVAGADGTVSRAEVQTLLKIFALLGLPDEAVYAQVHELGGAAAPSPRAPKEPVVVRPATTPEPGFAIPPRPTQATPSPDAGLIQLDMARVQAQIAESARVSAVLADIFRGEEEQAPPPPPRGPSVAGLDSGHSALFARIAGRDAVERSEWAEMCVELNLMPDGAIDLINEAAFDTAGDPLLSGDDPIRIDPDIYRSLQA